MCKAILTSKRLPKVYKHPRGMWHESDQVCFTDNDDITHVGRFCKEDGYTYWSSIDIHYNNMPTSFIKYWSNIPKP